MAELTLTDAIILAVIGAGLTALYARLNLKYQLSLDVSKSKLDKIQRSSNDYMLLASHARDVHELLCFSENYKDPCLYHMCKFFLYYTKIYSNYGGFELDDLESERAISGLVSDIISRIRRGISYQSVSLMAEILLSDNKEKNDHKQEEIHYNAFKTKLENDEIPIAREFNDFIVDKENRSRLHDYFLWLYKLLDFEVNYAYRMWYKREEKFLLDPAFKRYLQEKHFDRLITRLNMVGKNRFLKLLLKIKNWF